MVCGADVILLGGLFWTVLGNRPVHAAAGNGTWVQEGGETLDRAKGLEGKCVALTFDDGPHEECTAQLLDGLKERGVRVTFFLMGQNIEGNEELVKRMHDEGHLIGNHSFSHVQLTKAGAKTVCQAVDRTSRMIEDITGERPQYMRPPFGDWNEELECEVGMTTVLWSVDSLDWKLRNKNKIVKLHDELKELVYGPTSFSSSYAMKLVKGGSIGDIYGKAFVRDAAGNIVYETEGDYKGLPLVEGDGNMVKV